MANKRISDLTLEATSLESNDLLEIETGGGTSKKIKKSSIISATKTANKVPERDASGFIDIPSQHGLLISEQVASGNVMSLDFTGLNLNTHKGYSLEIFIKNVSSAQDLRLYINNLTTSSDYLSYEHSAAGNWKGNGSLLAAIIATNESVIGCYTLTFGFKRFAVFGHMFTLGGASYNDIVRVAKEQIIYKLDITNVTSVQLRFDNAGSIGSGSWARLYRKY